MLNAVRAIRFHVSRLAHLICAAERPVADRLDFVLALADRNVEADPFLDDGANGADLNGIADLLDRHGVGTFGIDLDM